MTTQARLVPLRITGAGGNLKAFRHSPLSLGRRQWAA